ncbi:conjugal transfer protein TraB, partial [Stenotrophomonas maltophilia]
MPEPLPETGDDLFAGLRVGFVDGVGVRYTLVGTALVSRARVVGVVNAMDWGRFDAVAVE